MTEDKQVVFYAEVKFETDKAYLVTYGGKQMWLPKSQIKKKRNIEGKQWKFAISEWIANEKGIEPDKSEGIGRGL